MICFCIVGGLAVSSGLNKPNFQFQHYHKALKDLDQIQLLFQTRIDLNLDYMLKV